MRRAPHRRQHRQAAGGRAGKQSLLDRDCGVSGGYRSQARSGDAPFCVPGEATFASNDQGGGSPARGIRPRGMKKSDGHESMAPPDARSPQVHARIPRFSGRSKASKMPGTYRVPYQCIS
jgi:hypothetical protein